MVNEIHFNQATTSIFESIANSLERIADALEDINKKRGYDGALYR